ncbi:unnamed protein product, partial [Pylaiella littoralis]
GELSGSTLVFPSRCCCALLTGQITVASVRCDSIEPALLFFSAIQISRLFWLALESAIIRSVSVVFAHSLVLHWRIVPCRKQAVCLDVLICLFWLNYLGCCLEHNSTLT